MKTPIFIFLISWPLTTLAEPAGMCERHPKTKKYESDFIQKITTQLETSKDPILILYRKEKERERMKNSDLGTGIPDGPLWDLKAVADKAMQEEAFPKNCINASMLTQTYAPAFYCTDGKNPKITQVKDDLCVSQEQVAYSHWLINKVYSCFNDPENPLDPRLVFLKLNNESTFDHTLCSSNGCGLGQLTPPAVKQMGRDRGIEHFVDPDKLDELDYTEEKQGCRIFAKLLYPEKNRLNTYNGFAKSSAAEKCKLLHPGQGAALNAMYSLGYLKYLTRRDGELKDSLALIDQAREKAAANRAAAMTNFELAQAAFDKKPNKKNTDALAVARDILERRQKVEGQLMDSRWEQYLLMAVYNQGAGGAGAAKVRGSYARRGAFNSLKSNLAQVGKAKAPIKSYMASVAKHLRTVASGQEPYTEQVFQVKREQVLENGEKLGIGACSLAQDVDAEGKPLALPPIASQDLTLKSTTVRIPASADAKGKN